MEQKNACHRVLAFIGHRQQLRVSNGEVHSRPAFQVMPGMFHIWLRHIEPEGREPRPNLFEKIEKAPCPAADVEKSQFAPVPSGKNFMELRQSLPARRIGRPVEEHLDLRVISTRRGACPVLPESDIQPLKCVTSLRSRSLVALRWAELTNPVISYGQPESGSFVISMCASK